MAAGDVYRQRWHYYLQRRPVFGGDSPGPADLQTEFIKEPPVSTLRTPSRAYYQQQRLFAPIDVAVATMDPPQRLPLEALQRTRSNAYYLQRRPMDNTTTLDTTPNFDPTLAGLAVEVKMAPSAWRKPDPSFWHQVRPVMDQSVSGVQMDPPQRFPFEALQRTRSNTYYVQYKPPTFTPDLELELLHQRYPFEALRRVISMAYFVQYRQPSFTPDVELELLHRPMQPWRRTPSSIPWQQFRPLADQSVAAAPDLTLELTHRPMQVWQRVVSRIYWLQRRNLIDQSIIITSPEFLLPLTSNPVIMGLASDPSISFLRSAVQVLGLGSDPVISALLSDPSVSELGSSPNISDLDSNPGG